MFKRKTYVHLDVNAKTYAGVVVRRGFKSGELVGSMWPGAERMPITVAWRDGTISTEDAYTVVLGD